MLRYTRIKPEDFRKFINGIIGIDDPYKGQLIITFDTGKIVARSIDSSKTIASKCVLRAESEVENRVDVFVCLKHIKDIMRIFKEDITIEFDEKEREIRIRSGNITYESWDIIVLEKVDSIIETVEKVLGYGVIARARLYREEKDWIFGEVADYIVVDASKEKMTITTISEKVLKRKIEVRADVKSAVKSVYLFKDVAEMLKEYDSFEMCILENKFLRCSYTTAYVEIHFVFTNLEYEPELKPKEEVEKKKEELEKVKILEEISVKVDRNVYDALKYIKTLRFTEYLLLTPGNVHIIAYGTERCNFDVGFVYLALKLEAYRQDFETVQFDFYVDEILRMFKKIRKPEIYTVTLYRYIENNEEKICVEEPIFGCKKSKDIHEGVIRLYDESQKLCEVENLENIVTEEFYVEDTKDGLVFINTKTGAKVHTDAHLRLYDKIIFCIPRTFKLPKFKEKPVLRVNEQYEKPLLILDYCEHRLALIFVPIKAIRKIEITTDIIKSNVLDIVEKINNEEGIATLRRVVLECYKRKIDKNACKRAFFELEKEGKIRKIGLGWVSSTLYRKYVYDMFIKELGKEGVSVDDARRAGIDIDKEFDSTFEKYKDSPLIEKEIEFLASEIASRVRLAYKPVVEERKEVEKVVEERKEIIDVEIIELRKAIRRAVEESKNMPLTDAYKILKQHSDFVRKLFAKTMESDYESLRVLFEYKSRTLPLATIFGDHEFADWLRNLPSPKF